MAYTARPDHVFQIAFNVDPNDPGTAPVYTDFTRRVRTVGDLSRGGQYELAQPIGAQPDITVRDVYEYLNSLNTGSPHYPNVTSYRSVLWQGVWPNAGTGNLLNAGTWRGNNLAAVDPTFDSYTSLPWWAASYNAPAVALSTVLPHSGTRCVVVTVDAAGTNEGVQFTIPTIPGRAYTCSAYVRLESANTVTIGALGIATGTSSTTVGAYVRITVSFTATKPSSALLIYVPGTAAAGFFRVDDVQHEAGATASTFTSTGAVIYPIFAGYAEQFIKTYLDGGFTGYATMPCVDGFAAMASATIRSDWTETLLQVYQPDAYWPLSGATGAADYAPIPGIFTVPPFATHKSKAGAGTPVAPGTPIAIPGDAGATGVQFTPDETNFANTKQQATDLAAGLKSSAPPFSWPPNFYSAPAWQTSVAFWLTCKPLGTHIYSMAPLTMETVASPGNSTMVQVTVDYPNFSVTATMTTKVGLFVVPGSIPVADGQPHLIVVAISQDKASSTTITLFVDGVVDGFASGSTTSVGYLPNPATKLEIGGWISPQFGSQAILNGVVTHVALWTRALDNSDVADLYQAGLGYAGILSGARIVMHLENGGFNLGGINNPFLTRISPGQTAMGPASYSPTIDLLTDTQNTATAENGHAWIAPDGALVFESRNDRYLRLTPRWTLDNSVVTTTPYGADYETAVDPTYVYANVVVTRSGGSTTVGGNAADVAATIRKYFNRASNPITADVLADSQAQDLANWIFYTHWYAVQRIASITLDPASNPTLWPICLSIEIGQRIRVVFNSPPANAGVGATFTADYFVEGVTQGGIDLDAGTWYTTCYVSPIGIGTVASAQPWILGDATYGVLDSTTRLGY